MQTTNLTVIKEEPCVDSGDLTVIASATGLDLNEEKNGKIKLEFSDQCTSGETDLSKSSGSFTSDLVPNTASANPKRGRNKRRITKVDMKAKLERSRQSAREW